MSEITPGRAAYEAWARFTEGISPDCWDHLDGGDDERGQWEAIGNTAVSAAMPAIEAAHARQLGAIASERDRYRDLLNEAGIAVPAEIEIAAAASHFAETWAELLTGMLADEYDCTLQCSEAEAAAYLYQALGDEDTAKAVIAAHAAYDEPGERHSLNPVADAKVMTARLAELEPKPFKVGDRVLITGPGHPWKGHTGTISGPFETAKDPDLKWTVALDDGWSTGAIAENEIRRADR